MSTPTTADNGQVTVQIADGIATLSFSHPKGNPLPGRV